MTAYDQLLLQPNQPLRLDAARHAELRVDCGTVWITATGTAGDLFLSAGASYRVPREGRVLVEAMRGAAGVRLVARGQRVRAGRGEWWRGLLPGTIGQQ